MAKSLKQPRRWSGWAVVMRRPDAIDKGICHPYVATPKTWGGVTNSNVFAVFPKRSSASEWCDYAKPFGKEWYRLIKVSITERRPKTQAIKLRTGTR